MENKFYRMQLNNLKQNNYAAEISLTS